MPVGPIPSKHRFLILAASCAVASLMLSGAVLSQTTAPSVKPGGMEMPAATSQPAAPVVPVDPGTPRGALKSLVTAMQSGDVDKIKSLIATTNPTEERMVAAMANMSASEKKFRTAAQTAFGPSAKELVGDTEAGTAEGMAKIDASTETINGNNATVDGASPAGVPPLQLTKVGDSWRIPVSELSRGVDQNTITQRLDDLSFMSKMMDESAGEVSSGKYKTPKEAGDAIKSKMMVAMMKRANAAAASQPTTGPADPTMPPPAAPGGGGM